MTRIILLSLSLAIALVAQDQPGPQPRPPGVRVQPRVQVQPNNQNQPRVQVQPNQAQPEEEDQPEAQQPPGIQVQPGNQPQPPIPGVQPPAPNANQPNPEPNEPPPNVGVGRAPGAPNPNLPTTLNVGNFTGLDVAELYNKYTGKLVLVSQEAAAGEISFFVPGDMTYQQAATIIEKKLVMEGYALIPDEDDPNLVDLVLASSPTSGAKAQGPPVIQDLSDLENMPADGFVTYVMPLEYLKPDEALRAFNAVVGQLGTAGTVAAVPNAGSVVISGNLPVVRMLAELKERIDVPSARVATKFVEVVYGDVEELAEKLNEIFNNQRQTQQSARVQRTGSTPATPAAPPTPSAPNVAANIAATIGDSPGSAGEETPINIIPQPRTSRIFLMGRPVDIIFVEGLIDQFDAPSSKRNYLQLKLRYLPVIEFLDVAADAIERTLETPGAAGGGAAGARRSANAARTSTRPTITQQGGGRNNVGGGFGGAGGGGTGQAQIQQQEIDTRPEPLLIGKTLLVADNISNTIVVNGPPHHIEIVQDLVEKLDNPSEQVAITAVFGRYNLEKNTNFGVDLAQLLPGGRDFTGAWQNRNGVPSVIDPNTFLDLSSLLGAAGAGGAGLSAYATIGDNFGVFVNALEANTNFTAISRPTVFTTNNGIARLSSGSSIAVPTSTFQGGATNGFSTNVEFRDIVLDLQVRPLVNSKDEVTLEIALLREDIGGVRDIAGFGEVPDIDTDEISTRVTVPNQSTIILGGLITESDNKSDSGIPILSSIPGIGRLFGSGRKDVSRQELVILIHPSILSNPAVRRDSKYAGVAPPESDLEAYQRAFDANSKMAARARASVENVGVLPARGDYVPDGGAATPPNAGRAEPVEQPATRGRIMTSPTHRALRTRRRR